MNNEERHMGSDLCTNEYELTEGNVTNKLLEYHAGCFILPYIVHK